MAKLRPIFKTYGGKRYLADWIISCFPFNYEKLGYLEPFCGGCSVFLRKTPSVWEMLNDIDPGIVDILLAIRNDPILFRKHILNYPYDKTTFKTIYDIKYLPNLCLAFMPQAGTLNNAIYEFILRRMSRAGLKKDFSWSNRLRGGKPGDVNAWNTAINLIPEWSTRLLNACICNRPALEIIDKVRNDSSCLQYIDPPYLHETRTSKKCYEFEMSGKDHIDLGRLLNECKGKVCISGYPSKLYDNHLYKNWNRHEKQIANHASQQKTKKTKVEVLWMNY